MHTPSIKFFVFKPFISAYVSNSLKYAILNAKYVLENNFTASASVDFINFIVTSFFNEDSFNKSANFFACSFLSPKIILDGYKLSYSAFPSLKNSGENIILFILYFVFILSVNPTGTVDLIIIVVCIFIFFIFSMVSSTSEVSKKLLFSS